MNIDGILGKFALRLTILANEQDGDPAYPERLRRLVHPLF